MKKFFEEALATLLVFLKLACFILALATVAKVTAPTPPNSSPIE